MMAVEKCVKKIRIKEGGIEECRGGERDKEKIK